MKYIKKFNESRKFKSFQKEKQDAIDKKEEEERRKSWKSNIHYTQDWDEYGDNWPSYTPKVTTTPTRTNSLIILTQEQRASGNLEAKKRMVYEEALKDLYPEVDVRKLPEACIDLNNNRLYGIIYNKDYDVVRTYPGLIYLISDYGKESSFGSCWLHLYKKYTFDVYTTPKEVYSIPTGNHLTKDKSYKIFGETEENYEIQNDFGYRKSLSKLWFKLPHKIENGKIKISRTESLKDYERGLYDE